MGCRAKPSQLLVIYDVGTASSNVTANVIKGWTTSAADGTTASNIGRWIDELQGMGQGQGILHIAVVRVVWTSYCGDVVLDLMSWNDQSLTDGHRREHAVLCRQC